ncbi:MAG: NADPH-dependent 7-cyano-7-deazaguanine reductase QueF [Desulfobacteraceae bacterium]|nr:NADPH-dependent 7-cyano-7-deazaguanine reductase QueF [Desulfobacteraceae bacterium]
MSKKQHSPEGSTLGKKVEYISEYDAKLLFPISRKGKRDEIGVDENQLPFGGVDIWNGYEVSWLNKKGKPKVAIVIFTIPCTTSNIIESKSFKLYLNSFNQTRFENKEQVQQILEKDLSKALEGSLKIQILLPGEFGKLAGGKFSGICLDDIDTQITDYGLNPDYLVSDKNHIANESLYTDLLKSNCLVTGQPDWGSLFVKYKGPKINHEGLLKYVISLRQHNEFHEQCVERIFTDIMEKCKCEKLTVYARYTRRGGLDINPFRSNFEKDVQNKKFARQ